MENIEKEDLTEARFAQGTKLPIKQTVAPTGGHRKEGIVEEITIWVDVSGVSVKDVWDKCAAQLAVDYKAPRRLEDSGGSFESLEKWEQWAEDLDGEETLHFQDVGRAPSEPITEEEAESTFDQAFARMSEEKQLEVLRKKQEQIGG